MTDATCLINGPPRAPATLVLGHGAGAPMDSPFMEAMASALGSLGWRVVRFPFPYMVRHQRTGRKVPPDALPTLLDSFQATVAREGEEGPLIIGGKSLGGRVASLLVDALAPAGVRGCLCLGYPFHPPGKPGTPRTQHLSVLATPTLILQGERDPFGRREEVEGYTLSPQVRVEWIPNGDHSFKPSRGSGHTEAGNWMLAASLADRFCRELVEADPPLDP